ncbi:hypothetical protein SAMN05421807_12913 [Virgibacillus chiguensis]|uniref:Uncharacterized protein n=2 Tax=Bacillaceae TaxID=186817 RepID=A0A1M5XMC6_9BACI|nr:hypothetical protein SAMN05421807_12913 [Virgibacillus chiguensis]
MGKNHEHYAFDLHVILALLLKEVRSMNKKV